MCLCVCVCVFGCVCVDVCASLFGCLHSFQSLVSAILVSLPLRRIMYTTRILDFVAVAAAVPLAIAAFAATAAAAIHRPGD